MKTLTKVVNLIQRQDWVPGLVKTAWAHTLGELKLLDARVQGLEKAVDKLESASNNGGRR